MRFHYATIVLCFAAVLFACTPGENERSASSSNPEQRAVGEIVDELGEKLWIVIQDKQNAHWFGSDGQSVYRVDGHDAFVRPFFSSCAAGRAVPVDSRPELRIGT